jgi:hypothetical protein
MCRGLYGTCMGRVRDVYGTCRGRVRDVGSAVALRREGGRLVDSAVEAVCSPAAAASAYSQVESAPGVRLYVLCGRRQPARSTVPCTATGACHAVSYTPPLRPPCGVASCPGILSPNPHARPAPPPLPQTPRPAGVPPGGRGAGVGGGCPTASAPPYLSPISLSSPSIPAPRPPAA